MAIGGYRLLERIDEEPTRERWRARSGRREVVIERGASPELDPNRFEREVRAAAALRHEALPRILAHGLERGRPWVAHESAAGAAVRDRLGSRRLSPEAALLLVHPVVDALSTLHAAGVGHGGVRLENVRISPGGDVRLLGMSLVGASGVDPREDVRAVGALFFQLIAGRSAGASLLDLDRRVPVALDALVRACLAREPSLRPRDGRALLERLVPLLPCDPRALRIERLALLADPSRWHRANAARAAARALEDAARARAAGDTVNALRAVERALAYGGAGPEETPPPEEEPSPSTLPERSLPGWTHGLAAALGTALFVAISLGAMMWMALE